MELGLTTFAEIWDSDTASLSERAAIRLNQVVEEAVLADEIGLSVYAVGEHHRPDFAASAPSVILATIAGRTQQIRLAPAVTVLSSDDPVRVYQQFATLDLLSDGRAEMLVGRGSFIESFPLFGYSLEDYEELFAEKLDLLIDIRDNERVTWSGNHRAPLSDAGVYPRSHQDPLPIWVGVGGTPQSAIRAGQRGLPMALAIIGGIPDRFAVFSQLHQRAATEAGYEPGSIPVAVHAHGHIAPTREQAIEEFWPSYRQAMTRIGRERGWGPMTFEQFEAMISPEGSLVLGTPDEVADKITRWGEVLGLSRFMLHVSVGSMEHEHVLRTIEMLGTDVNKRVNG